MTLVPVYTTVMHRFLPLILILSLSLPLCAQAKKRIFLITDAEGVAGVCRQDLTDSHDPELRQLLVGEVNAAVQGFFDGGADEVVVWDGHGSSQTLSALTIHPQALLLSGVLGPSMTLERHYSAIAFLGQHSKANVQKAVMAHSFSSLGIQNMRLNGKAVGEVETIAALAGTFGTPVIFLSGDTAAADELRAIVPDAEAIAVKEGLGRYTCISKSAEASQAAIREHARLAVAKIGSIRPYLINGPVTLEVEYTTRNSLPASAASRPGAEVVDDRTIRYHGQNLLEAWTRYSLY